MENMSHNKDPWQRKRQIFSPKVAVKNKKRRFRAFKILWLAFKKASTLIGAAVIISSVLAAWTMSSILNELDADLEMAGLPDEMVLYLEIDGDIPDQGADADFSQPFSRGSKTLKD